MSSSPNLPAGFSITSINGQRCTAVPRASTTLTGAEATFAAAFTTTTTSTQAQPNVVAETTSVFSAEAASSSTSTSTSTSSSTISSAAAAAVSSSSAPPLAAATTSSAAAVTSSAVVSTSIALSSSPRPLISVTALPASKGTTPTVSSSTAIAIAQSDTHPSPSILSGINAGSGFQAPSKTALTSSPASTSDVAASASAGISSTPRLTAAPVVGGVVGSMGLIAVLALIFWVFRRRRKVGRESLLTPLTTGRRSEYYDDNAGLGPTGRGSKWKAEVGYQKDKVRSVIAGIGASLAGIGASLRSKVAGDRSDTPSVNLNRGNSQFLDGAIPQHSRNNSVLSNNAGNVSAKDRLADWWERVGDKIRFASLLRRNKEPADPFAAARGMTEKQANMTNTPDFSQLLGMGDRDLQLRAERRRASMSGTGSVPQIGSLGLDFGGVDDPFADPIKAQAWKPANSADPFADPKPRFNPFEDPVSRPEPSIPKANTYIADIRRSRGQSVDATPGGNNVNSMYRPPSTAVGSRYPSTIAPSRDSYRDTVISSFSANVRKGKGRSDPFDLERPELWRPRENTDSAAMYPNPLNTMNPLRMSRPDNPYSQQPRQSNFNNARIQSSATFTSKYSSGVSSLGDWGEPGPDLGSGNSSLRGNAGSNAGSTDFSMNSGKAYGKVSGTMEEMRKEWDEKRSKDNVSPVSQNSKASSKGGVGKAM